jgi:multidrug resistance protein MdtO
MMQILQQLRTELAPKPGRLENALRITALSVILVILLETFQTPFPAYSAYILFFISKEETASTLFTGLIAALSITVSVFLTIAIYMISADEPGLRLPLMALIIFAGMFISRASPFGPLAFLIGFLVTISLTLVDMIPSVPLHSSADLLTRSVLWLWVVVMLPVAVVVAGNIFTGRSPAYLFERGLKERIEIGARLLAGQKVEYGESKTNELYRYLKLPSLFNSKLQKNKQVNEALLAETGRLLVLLKEWRELQVSDRKLLETASECAAMLKTLSKPEPLPPFQKLPLPSGDGKGVLLLAAIIEIIERLPELLLSQPTIEVKKGEMHLLAPDAFTNPDYFRYALKTTLAIFIAYITYNMLDWPGIRTCMITCFFVSLGTFGETVQKMTLRLTGAAIGGGLGLATIIFIMPHLTTIMGLSLMIGGAAFFAAWVAASSERLSYAGLQIALAYFLSVLVGYGPTTDLTESRDRVVGVLLGNLIIFLVYRLIWPKTVLEQAKFSLAAALSKLSQLIANPSPALFLAYSDARFQASRFLSFKPFEPKAVQTETLGTTLQDAVQALCGPVILLADKTAYSQLVSAWLAQAAEHLQNGQGPLTPPPKGNFSADDWFCTLEERMDRLQALINEAT